MIQHEEKSIFEWNDQLSVGLEGIDNQHKTIIHDLNELYFYIKNDSFCYQTAYEMLLKFKYFVEKHFECEENYMFYIDYPYYHDHRQSHELMSESIDKMLESLRNKTTATSEISSFVRKWLFEHIKIEDAGIVDFAREQPAIRDEAVKKILKPFEESFLE